MQKKYQLSLEREVSNIRDATLEEIASTG